MSCSHITDTKIAQPRGAGRIFTGLPEGALRAEDDRNRYSEPSPAEREGGVEL